MVVEKGYLQSDEFSKKEYQDKVDFLSEHSPTFSKMEPAAQREFIFKRTKQPEYKPRDTISKVARFAVPLAGQYGGEAVGGAAGLETGPGALATAMAGGGAGATLGEGAVDLMDFVRGMGPRPSLKGELRKAPMRAGYGAVGSGLGKGLVKLVNPSTMEGPMERLFQNPRLYTRELTGGELFNKGVGSEEKIAGASQAGEESIGKFQADAQNKVVDAKSAMKKHWNKQQYGDPVSSEFEPQGPEPKPTDPKYKGKPMQAYIDDLKKWQKGVTPPKKVSLDLNSLYQRYTKAINKEMPTTQEVPELVSIKRNLQDKIYASKADPASRLPDQDWRRIGKITTSIDDRLAELDPKLKQLELKYSEAMDELHGVESNPVVKKMGAARGEEFTNKFSKMAKKRAERGSTPGGEAGLKDMQEVEEKSGIPFTKEMTKQLASEHFRRMTPEMRSMWLARTMFAAPFVLGGGLASGRIPPFWAGMLPFAAMMNPRIAAHAVTDLPKYGMQALSQAFRQKNEPEPQ